MIPGHLIIHHDHAGMIPAGTGMMPMLSWLYIPINMPVNMVWTVEFTQRPHYGAMIGFGMMQQRTQYRRREVMKWPNDKWTWKTIEFSRLVLDKTVGIEEIGSNPKAQSLYIAERLTMGWLRVDMIRG